MSWLGLLLVFNTASAECEIGTSTRDLAQSISDVESAFVSMDINAFNEAETHSFATVECLQEALTPYDAAGFHRMSALRSFIVRDESSARVAYVAALTAQPNYNLPESLAPKGRSLEIIYNEARVLADEETERVAVDIPKGAIMLVDGRRDPTRPIGRPALIQLLDLKGVVLWSGHVSKNGIEPDFSSIEVEAPAGRPQSRAPTEESSRKGSPIEYRISGTGPPRKSGFSKSDRTLLLASAASAITSIALYGAAASVAGKHADETTPYKKLDSLRSLNHGLIIASGLAGGAGVGLGAVIYFK